MVFILKIIQDLNGVPLQQRKMLSQWAWGDKEDGLTEERFVMSLIVLGGKYKKGRVK